MDIKYYNLNPSQEVVRMQTLFTLFKRVVNILFSLTFEDGFDRKVMSEAINLLIERNDCLRIRFVKRDGKTMQCFDAERKVGPVPEKTFSTFKAFNKFLSHWACGATNIFKGDVLRPMFVTDPEGKQLVCFKISHFVADDFAIGVLVNDLVGIYRSLKEGTPMPPVPASFEAVLAKNDAYLTSEEELQKDRNYWNAFYTEKHPEHPVYQGLHGNRCDFWQKSRRKGNFSIPYLFVRCDTRGYRFRIPASIGKRVMEWSAGQHIPPASFFFFSYALTCSLLNDRQPYLMPLMLLSSRATVSERKCGGTMVQSIGLYTTVDYGKSFNENVAAMNNEQNEQYRHTKLKYTELDEMQHKVWGHSRLSQTASYCFSYIPFLNTPGVELQLYSNRKGALPAYIALMHDTVTNEVEVIYDVQPVMLSAEQLIDFQSHLVHNIEVVLDSPDAGLGKIF